MSDLIIAKGTIEKAKMAYQAGEYLEAAEHYRKAAEEYATAGDRSGEAEMLNNCCVALLKGGKVDRALQAAQGTDLIFAQVGDKRRQALSLGNQASALEALGRLREAAELYQSSASLLKEVGDAEMRATVLRSLVQIQLRTRKYIQALVSMQLALDLKSHLTPQETLLKKLLSVALRTLRI